MAFNRLTFWIIYVKIIMESSTAFCIGYLFVNLGRTGVTNLKNVSVNIYVANG